MRKIALHWQILIALVAAIIYGLSFPTSYEINKQSYKTLTRNNTPPKVQKTLSSIEGENFETMSGFLSAVKEIPLENLDAYKADILRAAYYNPQVSYVSWMGNLFIRALKMLIIPLILSSLISGITSIGSGSNLGRLGLKTLLYYVMTSLFAILVGQALVNLFKPGVGANINFVPEVEGLIEKQK